MLVVHVGFVEFEHREFRIVLGRDPLIPEITVYLVHPFETAHGQPFQIELGRHAEVEVQVERVVMRHKGPRQGAAGHRLHHRRLDFEEPAAIEKAPDTGDDFRPGLEDLAGRRIDDEVEVALAIPRFDVRQTVPLLGQGHQALGEKVQTFGPDGELVRFRPKEPAFHPEVIAQVEQLMDPEVQCRQRIFADVHLQPAKSVGQDQKVGLAESADAEDSSRDPDVRALALERVAGLVFMVGDDRRNRARPIEPVRVRRHAEPDQLLELGFPLRDLFRFVGHGG